MTGSRARAVAIIAICLAVPLTALAWLAYALRESAVAVVADLSIVGIGLAATGLAASLAAPLAMRGRRISVPAIAGAMTAASALVALGLLASFRFLYFTSEAVRFRNGDVVLAGTLHEPRSEGPHPAVVLVHGSGAESRDEYAFFARYLAKRGIAALAYDKRGVGESTGELYAAHYSDYADDAVAAVRLLMDRPAIDRESVGLVGFSEAEWVAPLAASRFDRIAFVAVVGASGLSPAEQVSAEMALRLRARGYADSTVRQALELNERVFAYQRSGERADALESALRATRGEPWFADAEDLPEEVYPAEDYAWWRSVMDFDSDSAWAQVRVPVLLLKGGRDDRSSPEPMRGRIVGALRRGGNEAVDVRVFPDADHMLLEWPRGEGTPPPVFADGWLHTLVDWIVESKRSDVAIGARRAHPPRGRM